MALVPPDFLAPLLRQPVAILGGGVSGIAVRELLGLLGARADIYDEQPGLGIGPGFDARAGSAHPLVVFSPGFPPDHPWLCAARGSGCTCLTELDFASLFWPGRLLAITGTNGKTTLTEFLTHALESVGVAAYAVGNVGFPFSRLLTFKLDIAESVTAVCEVSSFQAETLRYFRPEATLWTNFAEDHLERHPGLQAYFDAKWNLVARTRPDGLFAGTSVQHHARRFGRAVPPASCVASEGAAPDPRLEGTVFERYPQRENFLLAQAWWRADGRPEPALYDAARTFAVGRHRMTRIGGFHGVSFWNDSKATNFHAVEAALASFDGPVHLIAGGKAKGGDLAAFVKRIAPKTRHAWLIGDTRDVLAECCAATGIPHTVCATLDEAVRGAYGAARPGEHILLSPAFASFDMFRGYADRGNQFEKLVSNLQNDAHFSLAKPPDSDA